MKIVKILFWILVFIVGSLYSITRILVRMGTDRFLKPRYLPTLLDATPDPKALPPVHVLETKEATELRIWY